MKVKLLTTYAGPNGNFDPGTIINFDDATARALIKGGFAIAPEKEEAKVAEVLTPAS